MNGLTYEDGAWTLDGRDTKSLVERMIQRGLAARPLDCLTPAQIRELEILKCRNGGVRTGRPRKKRES